MRPPRVPPPTSGSPRPNGGARIGSRGDRSERPPRVPSRHHVEATMTACAARGRTVPTRAAAMPAAAKAAAAASACAGSTAASRPPEVCGSKSSSSGGRPRAGRSRPTRREVRLVGLHPARPVARAARARRESAAPRRPRRAASRRWPRAISRGVADEAEAGDVGAARGRCRAGSVVQRVGAARFSVSITSTAASIALLRRAPELDRGGDDAGAERLGQEAARRPRARRRWPTRRAARRRR